MLPRGAASIRTIATMTTKPHNTNLVDFEVNFSIMTLSFHRFRHSNVKRYPLIS
jgi:hypothetical protein